MEVFETKKVCSECGAENESDVTVCANCGCPFEEKPSGEAKTGSVQVKRIAGIVCCLLSIFLFYQGFMSINNSTYEFYQEHYADCQKAQQECLDMAYSSTGFFRSSYLDIVDQYQDLMEDDMEQINACRYKAIGFGCGGLVSLGAGIVLILKRKKG